MFRLLLLLTVSALLVAAAVYILNTSNLPLSVYQGLGAALSFTFGWIGISFAGSRIIGGIRDPHKAVGEAVPEAEVRRLP